MPGTFAAFRASIPQVFNTVWKKTNWRLLKLRLTLQGADEEACIRAERRMRGKEQVRKLGRADIAVVSFGKSGRTWVRVMISRLYQQIHGLPENALLGFDNFHNMDKSIPRVFFTHDNYIGDYTGH
ncbi:MAG: hypothetical protein LPK13_09605, partial [Marinobacter sp.]|nr:hypothetical protein [Marinobacter sp.]